ncbi:MAG: hypothetical protein JXB05_16870 [Myxococcaceae bacterium]|nr:hypothetical protein [Myxococcaceae bacterium]
MAPQGNTPAEATGADAEAVPKPGQLLQEERPRKQRVFVVARSVEGHDVVNTLDLSPHFEFSF